MKHVNVGYARLCWVEYGGGEERLRTRGLTPLCFHCLASDCDVGKRRVRWGGDVVNFFAASPVSPRRLAPLMTGKGRQDAINSTCLPFRLFCWLKTDVGRRVRGGCECS